MTASTPFLHRRLYGIKVFEYLLVVGMYMFVAYCYNVAIWVNELYSDPQPPISELWNLREIMDASGLEYSIKLILSSIIWWVIFRKFKHITLKNRLLLHIIGLPLFVVLGMIIYYPLSEAIGFGHLRGYAQVWDIFISGLFYLFQFGIFHAYQYYHDNQRNLVLKAELSKAAIKSELAALKAQVNPHFLYNVFNTINASLPPEQEKTRELIAKLSDMFRYQLKASTSEFVPLSEELDFVMKYLDLEKARFEDRLRVIIDVPEALKETPVPPMILQPLVENSVKHGISKLIDGGEVMIRVRQEGQKIAFEVSDTGAGVVDKSTLFNAGVGLNNTKLRLEKQYGAVMKLSDNKPQGLKIQFAI